MNKLKNIISMLATTRPWQKTVDFVDGLKGKLPDEELAVIKRYVEKRSREAAQAQVTVKSVDTVQYRSPSPQTPEPSPDVCVKMENNEGKMDPELKVLEPSSAGTGLETPGQQCHPTWETERTPADGFLTASVGTNQGGNISSLTERVDTRAGTKSTTTSADITFLQQGYKPKDKDKGNEENKQFDPSGIGEKAPLWNATVTLSFFFWGER